jgi:hypothetical protein
MLIRTF